MKDIEKSAEHPDATKDDSGSLMVGAALGTGSDTLERAKALSEAGVDVFVFDSAHGHSKNVVDTIKMVKKEFSNIDVIGGNVATPEGALELVNAGADAIKVGMGPGSICTTRIIAGIGVPQITAILDIKEAIQDKDVGIIADGGIRFSGDASKAFAAGAHSVMIGSMLAGTEESPGEVELFQGRSYKAYRGMGSLGAMGQAHGSSDRYFQAELAAEKLVPEGIEGRVPFKGSIRPIIHQIVGGIRSSMGYTGCKDLVTMRTKAEFVQVTAAGMTESHVHDVAITKEAPNYHQ
jgi:IMP dehydrogenase